MNISTNNPLTERPPRNIFIIVELDDALLNLKTMQVVSNRQLVFRWVKEAGQVFIKRPGKAPKALKTYVKLCRAFEDSNSIRVIVLDKEGDQTRYELLKCPVLSK